jgi:hypothetical protein
MPSKDLAVVIIIVIIIIITTEWCKILLLKVARRWNLMKPCFSVCCNWRPDLTKTGAWWPVLKRCHDFGEQFVHRQTTRGTPDETEYTHVHTIQFLCINCINHRVCIYICTHLHVHTCICHKYVFVSECVLHIPAVSVLMCLCTWRSSFWASVECGETNNFLKWALDGFRAHTKRYKKSPGILVFLVSTSDQRSPMQINISTSTAIYGWLDTLQQMNDFLTT